MIDYIIKDCKSSNSNMYLILINRDQRNTQKHLNPSNLLFDPLAVFFLCDWTEASIAYCATNRYSSSSTWTSTDNPPKKKKKKKLKA